MDNELMQYYIAIGQLNNLLKNANSLESALTDGIRLILENIPADYALLWYADQSGSAGALEQEAKSNEKVILHPYYWRGDQDFAHCYHAEGEGLVGKVYADQKPISYLQYQKGMDESIDRDFEGIEIGSVICVPVTTDENRLGCIQLLQREGSKAFDTEMADMLNLFSSMATMKMDENTQQAMPWKFNHQMLSAREITRSFQNGDTLTKVLKGVNLDVYQGEFLVILGESGSGKSTFLNIIGGMDKATSGHFSFLGRDLSGASQDELTLFRRDNIGFIFQSYNLISTFTAAQNVDLIGELVSDKLTSDEVLEMVGLGDRKKNYPAQLSGGQQQRVSIARALVKKPKMIFADEPTSALDYTTSIEVLQVLENVVKNGTTLVMVTHNEEITRMADRVVRMRNGKTFDVTINRHPVHATDLVW